MNKKADIAILIPLFAIILLGVVVYGMMTTHIEWSDTQPVIGEKQEAVFNAYGDADALHIYTQQALDEAIREAQNTATRETINDVIQERYTQLLIANRQNPMYATPAIQRRLNVDVTATLPEPIRIPVTYGSQEELLARAGAGVFTRWPVTEAPVITSLFGKRDINVGSTNHPGIDIRAPLGTEVTSIDVGEVTATSDNSIWVEMDNGYTCGYLHVGPTRSEGARVNEGEVIARVIQDGSFTPHLDLRCYNHQKSISEQAATERFGEAHVGGPYTPPSDTTYVAVVGSPSASFLDPYCLFSNELQQALIQRIEFDDSLRESLSGLQTRDQHLPLAEQVSETCDAYRQHGLFEEVRDAEEHYLQAAFERIMEHERGFSDNPLNRRGVTKHGVTVSTLAEAHQITAEQASREIRDLSREEAEEILTELYLNQPRINQLPALIVPVVWDMAVHTNQSTAIRHTQEVLVEREFLENIQPRVNDEFIAAAQEAAAQDEELLDSIVEYRKQFYQDIVANDPTQEDFLDRWLARAESYRQPLGAQTVLARGAYAVDLTMQGRISELGWQKIEERTDLRNALRDCDRRDASCIQTATQPTSYQACSEPANQLSALIAACGEQLRTGCSCQLPLGVVPAQSNLTFNHQVLQVNDTLRAADWLGQEGSDEYEVVLGAENEDTQTSVHAFNRTTGQLRFSEITSAGVGPSDRTLNEQDSAVYYRVQTQAEEAVVFFSATNQTRMCEQTIQERYCRGEEEYVDVDHPLTRP